MVVRLVLIAGLFVAGFGCSGGEPEAKEPVASKEQATQAASEWTDEQKAAFKTAHQRARNGDDK